MEQIFLEIESRLIKGEEVWNRQEGLAEGKFFLTSLIALYTVVPGSVNDGGAADVVPFTLARPLTQCSIVSLY